MMDVHIAASEEVQQIHTDGAVYMHTLQVKGREGCFLKLKEAYKGFRPSRRHEGQCQNAGGERRKKGGTHYRVKATKQK